MNEINAHKCRLINEMAKKFFENISKEERQQFERFQVWYKKNGDSCNFNDFWDEENKRLSTLKVS